MRLFILVFGLCFSISASYCQVSTGSVIKFGVNPMKNANGEPSNLRMEMKKNGLIVVFSCNSCPFVVGSKDFPGWERQYNDLYRFASDQDIGFVLVNSNEAKREGADSYENMVVRAKEQNYFMSYLLDEGASLADFLKAKTTPHVFFFDRSSRIIYTGSIDNIWDKKRKKDTTYLKNAVTFYTKDKKIKPDETSPKGCSIKRLKQ